MGGGLFSAMKNCFLLSDNDDRRPGAATCLGVAAAIGINDNGREEHDTKVWI